MPLLLICGYPSSGKTTHAHTIARQLTERGCRVSIVNDESLGLIRAEAYGNPASEKIARGLLKAAVEQLLSKEQVVIADGCNYIKGFRYELYCGLRLVGSTHAVVHCAADVATCAAWDAARAAAGGDSWGEVLLRDYAARFEAPNDRQRWDRPLFTAHAEGELPLEDICAALLEGHQLKPNTSTVVVAVAPSQLLHALDTKTLALVDHIISYQDITGAIGSSPLPNCCRLHPCDGIIPSASLRNLRRTFLKSIQLSPPAPKDVCDLMMDHIITQHAAGLL